MTNLTTGVKWATCYLMEKLMVRERKLCNLVPSMTGKCGEVRQLVNLVEGKLYWDLNPL